ncbi:MAG: prealbumin-like fold domain-containing protein [Methanothrix sp.]
MRKVLAIAAALMMLAVVIMPALGYTNQAAGNQTYSIKAGDKLQNYSLVAMTPAHSLTPDMIVNKFSFKSAGIQSTRMPYSFVAGAVPAYSVKLVGVDDATALGAGAKGPALLGSMNKQQAVEPEVAVETPAVPEVALEVPVLNETVAAAEVPVLNETVAAAVVPVLNETVAAAEVPAVRDAVVAAAPVTGPYVIMGMAQDNNQAPLEGWNFDLSKDGAVVDSATSGADGKFNFVGLTSGVYTVSELMEEGWSAVSPENGTTEVTIDTSSVTDLVFVNQKA